MKQRSAHRIRVAAATAPWLVALAVLLLAGAVAIPAATRSRLEPAGGAAVIVIHDGREDLDGDGAFDVFEDLNANNRLDEGEDLDGDGRLTPPDGCEGAGREDLDCDGFLDYRREDLDGNGVLGPGEIDYDSDGRADPGTEDRNHNRILDDRPHPAPGDEIYLHEPVPEDQPLAGDVIRRLPPFYPYGYRLGMGGSPAATATFGGAAAIDDARAFESEEVSFENLPDGGLEVRVRFGPCAARAAGSAGLR